MRWLGGWHGIGRAECVGWLAWLRQGRVCWVVGMATAEQSYVARQRELAGGC